MAMEDSPCQEQNPQLFEDITPNKDGGILKTLVRRGEGEDNPSNGCKVYVHYVGRLESGEKFDSSRDRGEVFTFELGKNSVIKGWDLGVKTMLKNEVCELKIASGYAYGEKGFPPKIPENATLIFEIELLSWDDELVIPGIRKRLIKEGITGGGKPNLEGRVKVHVRGCYEGVLFDERDVEFVIGDGFEHGVIEGVEKGICKMKRYEKAKFFISSQYAFKDVGNEHFGIPPNADEIEYEICLFDFERVKEIYEMNYDEKLEKAQDLKDRGLKCVRACEYQKAIDYYERILKYIAINKEDSDYQRGLPFKIASNLNAALCYLKVKDFSKAKLKSEKVVKKLDPNNVKGYFRLGEAFVGLTEYHNAVKAYENALKIEPENNATKQQLVRARVLAKKQSEKEKKLYGDIFAKLSES